MLKGEVDQSNSSPKTQKQDENDEGNANPKETEKEQDEPKESIQVTEI